MSNSSQERVAVVGGRGRRRRGRGLGGAAVAILATALGMAALVAAPAGADPPWGFEQVTPVDKGGVISGNDTFQASLDGDSFLYTANGSFNGAPAESLPVYVRYLGIRGPDGWSNRGVDPPFDSLANVQTAVVQLTIGTSIDLSHALVASTRALTPGATAGGSNLYMRDTRTGALTLVVTADDDRNLASIFAQNQGDILAKYVAPDGRSALFLAAPPLLPGAPPSALYRWTASDGLQVASVLPAAEGGAAVSIGSAGNNVENISTRDSVPHTDGLAHIYFTAVAGTLGAYVRTGDETRAVSVSRRPGDPATAVPAKVYAVGDGGRYMLFGTLGDTPLTADTPSGLGVGTYLYRYDFAHDALTYVGAGDGVYPMQMTQDGQAVAFQSTSALAGAAVAGQPNVYLWRDGTLRYVATSDYGSVAAGGQLLQQLTPSGRYLAFTDSSTSAAQRFGYDNVSLHCPPAFSNDPGPCTEVYVYDADGDGGTGRLACASCRTDGAPPLGHAGDPNNLDDVGTTRLNSLRTRIVGDDGTVFFTTADALVPADGNGDLDVYAYHDGSLRLVSRATQGTSARFLDATPDGQTVFFSTNDAIVGSDTDQAVDVYMTRAGAGFPYTAPPVTPPCSEADCRAATAPPASPPVAGSVAFVGPGNVPDEPPAAVARKLTVAKVKPIRGFAGALKVRVPGAGRLTVSGDGLVRATRSVARATTYTVAVALTARARQALRGHRSTTRKARLVFTPSGGPASTVTLSLRYTAPATKQKGR